MPKKKRMGPPTKRPEDKQSRVVQVSLTEREYARLERLADGRPLALIVRRALFKVHPEVEGTRRR